jgi:enamine deaminase RidA (YjgF/YER057c/UK114 family)
MLTNRAIHTTFAPKPGRYSQARVLEFEFHKEVYISGMCADPIMGEANNSLDYKLPPSVAGQTKKSLEHVLAIVEAVGGSKRDIIEIQAQVVGGIEAWNEFDEIYGKIFDNKDRMPARVPIRQEKLFWDGYLVMISGKAVIPKKQ